MNVSLKPKLKKFIEDQVRAGHFSSTQDVLEADVARLMLEPDSAQMDQETLEAIDRAEAQLDWSEGIEVKKAFDRLRQKHLGA